MSMIWGKTKYYQFCLQVSIFPCIICWKDCCWVFLGGGILVKNHLTKYVKFLFFQDSLASYISMPVLCAVLIAIVSLKSGSMISFTLIFSKLFWIFRILSSPPPYEFKIDFSISKTKAKHWDFDRHCPKSVNLYLTMGNISNLISSLPNHEHKGYFHQCLISIRMYNNILIKSFPVLLLFLPSTYQLLLSKLPRLFTSSSLVPTVQFHSASPPRWEPVGKSWGRCSAAEGTFDSTNLSPSLCCLCGSAPSLTKREYEEIGQYQFPF